MICSTTEKNQAFYSSEILHVPKQSHFREAKKGVTTWVCVTTWGVTTWRHYSIYFYFQNMCVIYKIEPHEFWKTELENSNYLNEKHFDERPSKIQLKISKKAAYLIKNLIN